MLPPSQQRSDQVTFAVGIVILFLLLIAAFLIVRPFLSALMWGIILAIGTWPLFARVRRALGGRGALASALLVIVYMAVLVVPLVMVGQELVNHVTWLSLRVAELLQEGPPPPPAWLGDLPLVGHHAVAFYEEVAAGGAKAVELLRDAVGPVTKLLVGAAGGIGRAVGELLLALVCTGIFYANGEVATISLRRIVARIGGSPAERLITIAHATI